MYSCQHTIKRSRRHRKWLQLCHLHTFVSPGKVWSQHREMLPTGTTAIGLYQTQESFLQCMCMYVFICLWRLEVNLGQFFPGAIHTGFLKQVSLSNPKLADSARLAGQRAPGIHVCACPVLILKHVPQCQEFIYRFSASHSDLHEGMASTLPAEPSSPQPNTHSWRHESPGHLSL